MCHNCLAGRSDLRTNDVVDWKVHYSKMGDGHLALCNQHHFRTWPGYRVGCFWWIHESMRNKTDKRVLLRLLLGLLYVQPDIWKLHRCHQHRQIEWPLLLSDARLNHGCSRTSILLLENPRAPKRQPLFARRVLRSNVQRFFLWAVGACKCKFFWLHHQSHLQTNYNKENDEAEPPTVLDWLFNCLYHRHTDTTHDALARRQHAYVPTEAEQVSLCLGLARHWRSYGGVAPGSCDWLRWQPKVYDSQFVHNAVDFRNNSLKLRNSQVWLDYFPHVLCLGICRRRSQRPH